MTNIEIRETLRYLISNKLDEIKKEVSHYYNYKKENYNYKSIYSRINRIIGKNFLLDYDSDHTHRAKKEIEGERSSFLARDYYSYFSKKGESYMDYLSIEDMVQLVDYLSKVKKECVFGCSSSLLDSSSKRIMESNQKFFCRRKLDVNGTRIKGKIVENLDKEKVEEALFIGYSKLYAKYKKYAAKNYKIDHSKEVDFGEFTDKVLYRVEVLEKEEEKRQRELRKKEDKQLYLDVFEDKFRGNFNKREEIINNIKKSVFSLNSDEENLKEDNMKKEIIKNSSKKENDEEYWSEYKNFKEEEKRKEERKKYKEELKKDRENINQLGR